MAKQGKARKRNSGQFKPGQSGNPNGRKPLPGDVKSARAWNQIEFARRLNYWIEKGLNELREATENESIKGIDAIIVSVILNSIKDPGKAYLNTLLDRLIGKQKEKVEITASPHGIMVDAIKRIESQE